MAVQDHVEKHGSRLPRPQRIRLRNGMPLQMERVRSHIGMPLYRCPECRSPIMYEPFKVPALGRLISVLLEEVGSLGSQASEEGRFVDFF